MAQILFRFQNDNIIVREKVQTVSGNTIHTYIAQTDIDTAIAQNTRGTHISGQVYSDLRSKLRMVKLIKKADRAQSNSIPAEQRVLSTLREHGAHNFIQAIPERDNGRNTWITMPHIGPSLKDIQTVQRDFRTERGNWLELPQPFLWRTLHGIAKGLAWLHSGVSPDYAGGKLPTSWRSIAHNLSAANIILDTSRLDEHGYPSPVLYHFHESNYKPETTQLVDWRPANQELETLAAMFHQIAHGRAYRNTQVTGHWCDCFTSTATDIDAASFLKCTEFPPSRKFRDLLEPFAYASEDGDATAADLLAMLNSPFYQREFGRAPADVGWYPLPERVREMFVEHAVGNLEFRRLIPRLEGVWGDVNDGYECMNDA